jgi:hypothetical protein
MIAIDSEILVNMLPVRECGGEDGSSDKLSIVSILFIGTNKDERTIRMIPRATTIPVSTVLVCLYTVYPCHPSKIPSTDKPQNRVNFIPFVPFVYYLLLYLNFYLNDTITSLLIFSSSTSGFSDII